MILAVNERWIVVQNTALIMVTMNDVNHTDNEFRSSCESYPWIVCFHTHKWKAYCWNVIVLLQLDEANTRRNQHEYDQTVFQR
mmetsp:Transcript_15922/g.44051  ORF Transcript_15922/g.44051 Transcript_15922/m.44051 type:complete len:83 (+) Transcript_15922:1396-1644(+)